MAEKKLEKPNGKAVKAPEKAIAAAKPRRKEKKDKPNKIQRWWRSTIGELRKVTWPTTKEAWRLTKITLIVMAFMSAILGLLDFVFSSLVKLIIS
ncbi:MAG: preprotein translocase subunit SecE [Anaerolineaceae bacterium]